MPLGRADVRYSTVLGGVLFGGLVLGSIAAALTAWTAHAPALPVATLSAASSLPAAGAAIANPAATAVTSTSPTGPAAAPLAQLAVPVAAPATAENSSYAFPHAPSRLVIPALGIDSQWIPLSYIPGTMLMDSPPAPDELGWYTFTGQPGGASNAVFAGHVDWHTGTPALFSRLNTLGVGTEVQVSRADGLLVNYRVVSSTWYRLRDATAIIAPTAVPSVTLITCGGDFDPTRREYNERLVVRAVADSP